MSEAHKKRVEDGTNNFLTHSETYAAVHFWLRSNYGRAHKCENIHCNKPDATYFEWANVSKNYRKDRKDFIQLCASCHRKWDLGVIEIKLQDEEFKFQS